MNRHANIKKLRSKLAAGEASVGSWMQLPHASVAEIMGSAGYDWVAVDLEHGSISVDQLPDLFRALELGGTLPFVRLAHGHPKDCKQALDAGAGGIIVPMVETAAQLTAIIEASCWPPTGRRGVGFSRANGFGRYFEQYKHEAQEPFVVAQIENITAVNNLESIVEVKGLDAILIGPYDLSASMGMTAQFDHPDFLAELKRIGSVCQKHSIFFGDHIVYPDPEKLKARIKSGCRFIAYSIDAVFLNDAAKLNKGF